MYKSTIVQAKEKQVKNRANAKYRKNDRPHFIFVPTTQLGCRC